MGTISQKTSAAPKTSEDQTRHMLQKDLDRGLDNTPGSKGGREWVEGFEDMTRRWPELATDSSHYKANCTYHIYKLDGRRTEALKPW